jgi:hypothetical protein
MNCGNYSGVERFQGFAKEWRGVTNESKYYEKHENRYFIQIALAHAPSRHVGFHAHHPAANLQ